MVAAFGPMPRAGRRLPPCRAQALTALAGCRSRRQPVVGPGTGHGHSRIGRVLLLAAVLSLAACTSQPVRDQARWRSVDGVQPAEADSFRLSGRLAVSDGRDGGSAGFLWLQEGEAFQVELRQPVSQRTWRLSGNDQGAVLDDGSGRQRAGSAEELLYQALGWHLPVTALRDWVRGLAHAGLPVQEGAEDAFGRWQWLLQDGWRVEYRNWLGDSAWPLRIEARKPPYSVRLSIQDWAVPHDHAPPRR